MRGDFVMIQLDMLSKINFVVDSELKKIKEQMILLFHRLIVP